MALGLVPGTEPAARFVAALRAGQVDEARRIAVEEAPVYELTHFVIEPLIAKLESLPSRFMAGREASRKLAHMLVKELVDQMFAGDVSTGGHQGADGRWYVFKGLSPDLVEVSSNVIENVDKARFLEWIEPVESLLIGHLSGRMNREGFVAAARDPQMVQAATYRHRSLQGVATGRLGGGRDGAEARRERKAPWDPVKDPDLRVCFSGEHGYIVVGSGQSHLIDQVYLEALRIVRQMSQRELLAVARQVPGEMLQPDYPNLIRNVAAQVTPILGLSPDNRREIREDMEAGGRNGMLTMLALSRARHAGWLSDAVVEEIYALRGRDQAENGASAGPTMDAHQDAVTRLMEHPDDRAFLQTLDSPAARILVDDAIQLLQHDRARPAFAGPVERLRRGLALLKILCLQGVLDGFMIHPFAGRNLFAAQFGRLAALDEQQLEPDAKSDRQLFLEDITREEEVCRRAGLYASRVEANLVTQRVPGLLTYSAAIAERALQSALQAMPGKPVTVLFHLREWIRTEPASPVWARDLDQAYSRLLAPWAAVLRPGDYLVLFEGDAVFRERLLGSGAFEQLDAGVSPVVTERSQDAPRVEPARGGGRRLLSALELPVHATVLRRTAPVLPQG